MTKLMKETEIIIFDMVELLDKLLTKPSQMLGPLGGGIHANMHFKCTWVKDYVPVYWSYDEENNRLIPLNKKV